MLECDLLLAPHPYHLAMRARNSKHGLARTPASASLLLVWGRLHCFWGWRSNCSPYKKCEPNNFFSSSKTYSFPWGGWKRINNQVEMELIGRNTDSGEVYHGSKLTAIFIMKLKLINVRNNLSEMRKFQYSAFILAIRALFDNLKQDQTIKKYITKIFFLLLRSIPFYVKEHKTLFTFLKTTLLNWMNNEHPKKWYPQQLGMIYKQQN